VDFTQTFHWKLVGETEVFEGTLIIAQGDRFHLTTGEQIIISDGKTLWTHDIPSRQVIVEDLQKTEDTLLPKELLFKYSREYVPTLKGKKTLKGRTCYVLELKPKTGDAFIQKMTVWVDAKEWITRKIVYQDINGNETTYEINSIRFNPPIKKNLFRFEPPAGVEVIDMR